MIDALGLQASFKEQGTTQFGREGGVFDVPFSTGFEAGFDKATANSPIAALGQFVAPEERAPQQSIGARGFLTRNFNTALNEKTSSQIKEERNKQREDAEKILNAENSSTVGSLLGDIVGFSIDPLNVAAGVATGPITGAMGRYAISKVSEQTAKSTAFRLANFTATSVVEGAVPFVPQSLADASNLPDDASIADRAITALKGLGFGAVLGFGFNVVGQGIKKSFGRAISKATETRKTRVEEANAKFNEENNIVEKPEALNVSLVTPESDNQMRTVVSAQVLNDQSISIENFARSGYTEQRLKTPPTGRFHGTSSPIKKIQEYTYNDLNIYGQGFYTTDNFNIATGYTKKGKGKEPTIYKIEENENLNIYDLESEENISTIDELFSLSDSAKDNPLYDSISHLKETRDKFSLRNVYDEIREGDYSTTTIQESFDLISNFLENKGYHGISHIGGRRSGTNHNVKIFFRPDRDLNIKQFGVNENSDAIEALRLIEEKPNMTFSPDYLRENAERQVFPKRESAIDYNEQRVKQEENYTKDLPDTQAEVIQRSLDELELLKESGDDALKAIADELQVETHFTDALKQTLKKDVLKCLLGG